MSARFAGHPPLAGSPGLEQTAANAPSGTWEKTAEMNSELGAPEKSVSLLGRSIRILLGSIGELLWGLSSFDSNKVYSFFYKIDKKLAEGEDTTTTTKNSLSQSARTYARKSERQLLENPN